MKTIFNLLKDRLKNEGNPALLDMICYLHPTHTTFQKVCEALTELDDNDMENGITKIDITSLLSSLHRWFSTSTACREDIREIREDFYETLDDFEEDLNMFFKRHVNTRWLEMQPCLERLLSLWTSTTHYFISFLPHSNDGSDKKAIKTDRFKTIFDALKPSEEIQAKARVKILIYLCKFTQDFLRNFQSHKPNYPQSVQ